MAGCGNSRDETISIMQILFSLETSNCKLCEVKAGHQARGWCIVWWPCIRASWPNTNTTTNPTLRLGRGKVAIRFSTKAINTTKWWAVQWPHLCGSYHIILVLMILHFDRWGSAFRGWVSKWVAELKQWRTAAGKCSMAVGRWVTLSIGTQHCHIAPLLGINIIVWRWAIPLNALV